ncbi:MAG: preprotein translocase subunit SecG [Sedimenticola sp.]|nr:preprotein translocase subunit SecG [Sedimenticola sp.]
MHTILVVVHLFLALGVIGLVLMQHGKGADAGAAFGSGSSGTVFGAAGSANFLSRATAVLATLFFLTSLGLAWFAMQSVERPGLMTEPQAPAIEIPAAPPAPTSEVPTVPGAATSGSGVPSIPPAPTGAAE